MSQGLANILAEWEDRTPTAEEEERWRLDAENRARIADEERRRSEYAECRRRMGLAGFPGAAIDLAVAIEEAGDSAMNTPALARAKRFLAEDVPAKRTMLVLSGGVGTGKSTAAAWFTYARRTWKPLFMRAATFARISRYDKEKTSAWESAGTLVLDDLGAEYADSKGNFLADLDELIDWYYADRRPLIITTNLDIKSFRERYGGESGRISSRIREAGAWAECGGTDLRRKEVAR